MSKTLVPPQFTGAVPSWADQAELDEAMQAMRFSRRATMTALPLPESIGDEPDAVAVETLQWVANAQPGSRRDSSPIVISVLGQLFEPVEAVKLAAALIQAAKAVGR